MYFFIRSFLILIKTLVCVLCLSLFLEGCNSVSGPEKERDPREERSQNRHRDLEDRGERDQQEGDRPDFSGIEASEREPSATPQRQILEPLQQTSLSNKIDFLFILDTSPSNRSHITPSAIEKNLGAFLHQLNNLSMDWRMLFTNADAGQSTRWTQHNNGELHHLEHDGALILSQYLDNEILKPYDMQDNLSSIFIDTLSHPKGQANCKMPPYCHKSKSHRPLKALSKFLLIAPSIVRKSADFIVIILSNKDEKPSSKRPKKPYEATEILQQFQDSFPDKNFFAISIVVKSGDTECIQKTRESKPAENIPQLSLLTNGLLINICTPTQNGYSTPIINFIKEKRNSET